MTKKPKLIDFRLVVNQTLRRIHTMEKDQFYRLFSLYNPKSKPAYVEFALRENIEAGSLFEEKKNGDLVSIDPIIGVNNYYLKAINILIEFAKEGMKDLIVLGQNNYEGVDFYRFGYLHRVVKLSADPTVGEKVLTELLRQDDGESSYIYMLENSSDIAYYEPITEEDSFCYGEKNDLIFVQKQK